MGILLGISQDFITYLPKIFVATKRYKIKWLDLCLNIADVHRKEYSHNLNKQPHQGRTGCDAQLFWSESSAKDKTKFYSIYMHDFFYMFLFTFFGLDRAQNTIEY